MITGSRYIMELCYPRCEMLTSKPVYNIAPQSTRHNTTRVAFPMMHLEPVIICTAYCTVISLSRVNKGLFITHCHGGHVCWQWRRCMTGGLSDTESLTAPIEWEWCDETAKLSYSLISIRQCCVGFIRIKSFDWSPLKHGLLKKMVELSGNNDSTSGVSRECRPWVTSRLNKLTQVK
jgi:hypothetical protein